ncbi:uncharacterized protein C19orf44 homolog [Aegotheles albertisi]
MAAVARAQGAAAGAGQGHSDAARRRTITAGLSVPPRPRSHLPAADTGLEGAARAPFCPSRFLKVRNENLPGSQRCQTGGSAVQAGNRQVAGSTPGSAFRARSSSALRRLAQLESKIMNRKKQMELQNIGLGQWMRPLDEESFSSASSHEHSARGKKYLKSRGTTSRNMAPSDACSRGEENIPSPKENVRVKQQLGLDSDEEEMRELMERSLEFSTGDEDRRVAASDSKRGGKDSAVRMTLPRTGHTRQSQMSLGSDRSDIKSLDELFSKADDAEDSTGSVSDDFRQNILSLDDLAPDMGSEAAEFKQNGTDTQNSQESKRKPEKDTFLTETGPAMPSAGMGMNGASEGDPEKTATEAEISEHLSESSTHFPGHKQDSLDHDERTVDSDYSDDFERSLSTTESDSVSTASEERSESHTYSGQPLSSPSSPLFTRERHNGVHRVTVKETAVQTADFPFTYCWPKTTPTAVLDPPVGHSYVDPVPIASHFISTDAVEALTAYSPSALVLNAILKQHLTLTQQFVENIHHLHCSLVESLEKEKFHYHTLEETKEYIKNHRSAPLTIEQAREEIQKAWEEKLL